MSDMEHNKGTLVPFEMTEEYAKTLVLSQNEELTHESYLEQVLTDFSWYDTDVEKIGDKFYTVRWEIQRGQLYGFADAKENMDGTIDFNTYHYNGGAHWTEVVEDALNAIVKS